MCKEIFAFRRVTPFSDFSLAERLIGDTISWEEISRQRLQNANQENQEEQHYDETMSNCQERYQDMTSRGLSDDDAIAAVVESLKGMEDVISQYPKKSEAPEAEEAPKSADVPVDDDGDGEQTDFTFHPADIGRIEMTMVCDDVHLEESPDGDVHVRFEDVEGATPMPRSATEAASPSAAVSPTGGCM